jgi:hypothetical protein
VRPSPDRLNVGGSRFETSENVLAKYPGTYFADLFTALPELHAELGKSK